MKVLVDSMFVHYIEVKDVYKKIMIYTVIPVQFHPFCVHYTMGLDVS